MPFGKYEVEFRGRSREVTPRYVQTPRLHGAFELAFGSQSLRIITVFPITPTLLAVKIVPGLYATPVQIDGIQAIALLTLKRVDKDNLYSLELEEIKQLGGTLDRLKYLRKENPSAIPLRADEKILNAFSEKVKEYFGETSSFSIRNKRRRQYGKMEKAYQNDLFAALYDEATRMEQETINFYDRDANIDDVLRYSARVRGLLAAMFRIVPREAQPRKTLLDLPERVHTLSRAAVNPHEMLSMQDSPGLTPEEVARYNDLTPEQRRADIVFKLDSAYRSLVRATARSIEAYLCRQVMDEVDNAMKSLQPKYQMSGKERRGITSANVFERATYLHTNA